MQLRLHAAEACSYLASPTQDTRNGISSSRRSNLGLGQCMREPEAKSVAKGSQITGDGVVVNAWEQSVASRVGFIPVGFILGRVHPRTGLF